MNLKQVNDSVFEALLRQAVIDNFYEEFNSVPPDEELSKMYAFSEAHELKMKRLFSRVQRKERIQTAFLWGRRVAAVVVITIAVLFGGLMLNQEVRAAVTNTIIEWFDRFTRFTSNAPPADATSNEPSWIPDGFWEETRIDVDQMMLTILYANDDGSFILFETVRVSGTLYVDNENRAYEIIRIDGIDYHVFAAFGIETENSVIWEAEGMRYNLTSTIPVDILLDMAVSVE